MHQLMNDFMLQQKAMMEQHTNMKGDSITPLEGTQHELICGICGRPKVEIEWLNDGLPINQTLYVVVRLLVLSLISTYLANALGIRLQLTKLAKM